jgi:DNA-binding HxlR family transcriptional regulator
VRVEYSLTKKGRALAGAIDSIADWAEKYVALEAPVRKTQRKTARAARTAVR